MLKDANRKSVTGSTSKLFTEKQVFGEEAMSSGEVGEGGLCEGNFA